MTEAVVLADTPLFANLGPDSLDALAASCSRRSLARGDVLFHQDDESGALYIVVSGRIAIANRSFDGRESMVALMEDGDLFGEMGLFDDGEGRSADARALEPSELIELPYDPIRELFTNQPGLLWGVVSMLSKRVRAMDNALADSVFLDVTGRTAKRLLEMAGDEDEFELPLTQEELAGMVGASRERVNKSINQFIKLGWMAQTDRGYRVTNREQLTIRSR
jgi:CRP-like cAMP-binding protein